MTDREMLELAARAAGRNLLLCAPDDVRGVSTTAGWWNPLGDDRAALRLAVQLELRFVVDAHNRVVVCEAEEIHYDEAKFGGDCDPYAATRRAIVRAAAEIGRQMEVQS